MLGKIKEERESIKREREQKKKLIEIMGNYRQDDCEKIVKYRLFIRKETPIFREEFDLYCRAADILKEMKFFTIKRNEKYAYGGKEKHKEIIVTGTPDFVKELCEFFADYEEVSKDNIEEVGELTEEEKEAIKKSKTKELLCDLKDFRDENEAILFPEKGIRYEQATDVYTGQIVLEIIKERAFVDLEEGIFEKIIKILDQTDELYKFYYDQGYTINIAIDVDYRRCAVLFDLLVKAFGRGNLMRCYMTIK